MDALQTEGLKDMNQLEQASDRSIAVKNLSTIREELHVSAVKEWQNLN